MAGNALPTMRRGSGGELRQSQVRLWQWLHKWSSLVCSLFLLLICITGLPLIFDDELHHWLEPPSAYAALPADASRANLDNLVAKSRRIYPGYVVLSVFVDDDEPQVVIGLAPSWQALEADRGSVRTAKFDARTGQLLERSKPPAEQHQSFMDVMLRLHMDLFAGLPGELFMGLMAMLFVVAIVSGVVLYGPFTRKLDFGAVRTARTQRVHWLDLHNLLGVVTLAWAIVVGVTGAMNELSTPLFALWQRTDVATMVAPWQGKAAPAQGELSSVQAAFDAAQRALPGMTVVSASYPNEQFGSPHHYLLFTKGRTPLTSRLFSPVLIDARTGRLTAVVQMPWYLRALEVSRPLHFGDYGGLPLKIIWTLLDLVTIVVLGSGLYLWIGKRKRPSVEAIREHYALPASVDLIEVAE